MTLAELGKYFRDPPTLYLVDNKQTALAQAQHAAGRAMHYRIITALARHKEAIWKKRAEEAYKVAVSAKEVS